MYHPFLRNGPRLTNLDTIDDIVPLVEAGVFKVQLDRSDRRPDKLTGDDAVAFAIDFKAATGVDLLAMAGYTPEAAKVDEPLPDWANFDVTGIRCHDYDRDPGALNGRAAAAMDVFDEPTSALVGSPFAHGTIPTVAGEALDAVIADDRNSDDDADRRWGYPAGIGGGRDERSQ